MRANVAAFVPQVMLKTNLFFCCSRRVCGREVVPFWRARKEPKSAQRGLKRVQVWTSAPAGRSPPLPFLAGKSSGGCPACRHFPCAVFRVENTKFALVCAKRDSGTGTHAFSRLFAVLCILRNRTVNTASWPRPRSARTPDSLPASRCPWRTAHPPSAA